MHVYTPVTETGATSEPVQTLKQEIPKAINKSDQTQMSVLHTAHIQVQKVEEQLWGSLT